MALPAIAVLIDPGHQLLVAPDTVFPYDLRSLCGQPDVFWDLSRIEHIRVPHALVSLPREMPHLVIVGQMTVDAFLAAMPGIVSGTITAEKARTGPAPRS